MIGSTLEFLRGGVSSEAIRPIDLVSVIETILDDQADQGQAVSLGGVGQGRALGRLLSLKRAFWNIIGNAVKYGDHITVAIAETQDGLAITIEDDGPGIPDSDQERVFQPFVRLEESRGRETGGSGLGLTIARAVVTAHGGEIALVNRPEGGLRVTITLPRLDQPEPRLAQANAASEPETTLLSPSVSARI